MKVLFIHEAPGQFGVLHNYLNETGLAESWLLCANSVYNREKDKIPNLLPFQIPPEEKDSYFYTKKIEARIKRSFLLRKAVLDFMENHALDVIVAHGSGGFPLQIFGEVDIPIISYIEFPSFTHHGFDERYPQPEYAKYVDKVFEMTSYHQAMRSEAVIVPSEYAKRMFPDYLHHKIFAQMEGFSIERRKPTYKKTKGMFHVGFAARDLSSAKGFERFIQIAKAVLQHRQDVKFVFCGSPTVLYSYETLFLQQHYGNDNKKTFMEYVLEREGIQLTESNFEHVSFAAYDDFAGFIESMDFFLYPLQFGSANWGLFELLFRGRLVIGSNRCFVPEVIKHRYNGLLCDYDDLDGWVRTVLDVMENPAAYRKLAETAQQDANERFHVSKVAPKYLSILEAAIHLRKLSS